MKCTVTLFYLFPRSTELMQRKKDVCLCITMGFEWFGFCIWWVIKWCREISSLNFRSLKWKHFYFNSFRLTKKHWFVGRRYVWSIGRMIQTGEKRNVWRKMWDLNINFLLDRKQFMPVLHFRPANYRCFFWNLYRTIKYNVWRKFTAI